MKPPLNPAYSDTVFQYVTDGAPTDFWVITAYNPDGKTIGNTENVEADERLREEIEGLGATPFRITGISPDGAHAEPGWGFPCDECAALDLGRNYRQEAVFHFTQGRIDLVDCQNGERHTMKNPESRIQAPTTRAITP